MIRWGWRISELFRCRRDRTLGGDKSGNIEMNRLAKKERNRNKRSKWSINGRKK